METLIPELIEALSSAQATGGTLAAIAVGLTFFIRLYRLEVVQNMLPASARWDKWPPWVRQLVPFLLAFTAALILALIGKMAVGAALVGALVAGVGAIAGHKTTKAVGKAEAAVRGLKPGYKPSPWRKAASAIVPIDKRLMAPMLKGE